MIKGFKQENCFRLLFITAEHLDRAQPP
nr:unnamed protein product [Callosobruchus analis]